MDDPSYKYQMEIILENAGGSFMLVKFQHCRYLKGNGNATLVFALLLNLLKMKHKNPKDRKKLKENELWIKCPAKLIQKKLGMWDKKQQTAIKVLVNANLIEKSHREQNILWIRVNTEHLKFIGSEKLNQLNSEKLNQLDRKVKPTDLETLNQLCHISNNKLSKNHIEETLPHRNSDECKKDELLLLRSRTESKEHRWAKILWDKVAEKSLLNPRRSRFQDWIKHFQILRTRGPRDGPVPSDEEIETYLNALLPHIAAEMELEFWPVVHSAKSFCDKFYQIKRRIDKKEHGHFTKKEKEDIGW